MRYKLRIALLRISPNLNLSIRLNYISMIIPSPIFVSMPCEDSDPEIYFWVLFWLHMGNYLVKVRISSPTLGTIPFAFSNCDTYLFGSCSIAWKVL